MDDDIPAEDATEDATEDTADEDAEQSDAEKPADSANEAETPPATGEEEDPPAENESDQDDSKVNDSASGDPAGQQVVSRSASARRAMLGDTSDDVGSTVTAPDEEPARSAGPRSQTVSVAAEANTFSATDDAFRTAATTSTVTVPTPSAPQPRPTLVSVVTDFVAAMLQPLLSLGQGSPIQIPILSAMLSVVRDELERVFLPRTSNVASQQSISQLVDPTDQHVLVIGVDGTNLSRILADPENENFFELMDTSTTAASSIVGHTTISGPSWSAILTGEWGEKTGVINNVFTPWTYDKWPTVFNQLETLNPDIDTMAIADWDVINAMAGAGSIPVDENVFIPQIPGDTNWLDTDDAVGAATVAAISAPDAPNFLFSYFVGVDENGHLYGGASPQYAEAIRNVDDNLGAILDAVAEREKCNPGPCEDWTIIVTTDHGHQSQKGFGHGFQTPNETATFVIADGPAFGDGLINPDYEIVDTTPTVVSLFGGTPRPNSDGVPLMTLSGSDFDPVDLHQALRDEIAKNHSPDIITNVALSLRTIFATVPYVVYTELPTIPIISDALYVATNIPAQIVAFLTGVRGASIFPLLPPPPPSTFIQEPTTALDAASMACGDGSRDAAACIAS